MQRFGNRLREECDRELASLWRVTALDDVRETDLARHGVATLRVSLLAEKVETRLLCIILLKHTNTIPVMLLDQANPAFVKAMA